MPPNHEKALHLLARARTRLGTARIAAETDPEIAYDALSYPGICVVVPGSLTTARRATVFLLALYGGDSGNRTRVQGFAGPCLSHSAKSPYVGTSVPQQVSYLSVHTGRRHGSLPGRLTNHVSKPSFIPRCGSPGADRFRLRRGRLSNDPRHHTTTCHGGTSGHQHDHRGHHDHHPASARPGISGDRIR